jgi:Cu(I)/Ag(I) efflux system membrane protein CusA/SilA
LSVADVQSVVSSAIGGENVGEVVDGRQRFPINVRYPQQYRDSVQSLREFPVVTDKGAQIRLGDIADVRITDGPPMIRSENARLSGWVYVDVRGTDLLSAVRAMQGAVAREVKLPPGYSIGWSGQFESMERAAARLERVIPATLLLIFVFLYLAFRSVSEALLLMLTVPFALIGGFWFIWLLGHAVSVATAVGFIALAGLAAEFGVVMLVYLRNALQQRLDAGQPLTKELIAEAIREGAVQRVRPKAMTVAVILAGLLPLIPGHEAGHEAMSRLAAPMVGGMLTAPLLSLFVIPAAWGLLQEHKLRRNTHLSHSSTKESFYEELTD